MFIRRFPFEVTYSQLFELVNEVAFLRPFIFQKIGISTKSAVVLFEIRVNFNSYENNSCGWATSLHSTKKGTALKFFTYLCIQFHRNLSSFFSRPSQFREMAVDSQVQTPDGHAFDVVYVGTTKGTILKIVNTADPNGK